MEPLSEFFSWLANEPAFIEVGVGVFYCLVVAPLILAGIATAITVLEGFVETGLSAIPVLNLAPPSPRSGGAFRWHSSLSELVSQFTGVAIRRELQKARTTIAQLLVTRSLDSLRLNLSGKP